MSPRLLNRTPSTAVMMCPTAPENLCPKILGASRSVGALGSTWLLRAPVGVAATDDVAQRLEEEVAAFAPRGAEDAVHDPSDALGEAHLVFARLVVRASHGAGADRAVAVPELPLGNGLAVIARAHD